MKNTVLVTGATGFLGKNLVEKLKEKGMEIRTGNTETNKRILQNMKVGLLKNKNCGIIEK